MKRSKERESVILVPQLQFNEGFFVLTHTASFEPRSIQFSSLSKMVTSLTSTWCSLAIMCLKTAESLPLFHCSVV